MRARALASLGTPAALEALASLVGAVRPHGLAQLDRGNGWGRLRAQQHRHGAPGAHADGQHDGDEGGHPGPQPSALGRPAFDEIALTIVVRCMRHSRARWARGVSRR
jgi:hypothetical protein